MEYSNQAPPIDEETNYTVIIVAVLVSVAVIVAIAAVIVCVMRRKMLQGWHQERHVLEYKMDKMESAIRNQCREGEQFFLQIVLSTN